MLQNIIPLIFYKQKNYVGCVDTGTKGNERANCGKKNPYFHIILVLTLARTAKQCVFKDIIKYWKPH